VLTPAIPTTQDLNGSGFGQHPIKNLKVLFDDKPPNLRSLPHPGMAFREKTKTFGSLNNQVSQIARGGWVIVGNASQ